MPNICRSEPNHRSQIHATYVVKCYREQIYISCNLFFLTH